MSSYPSSLKFEVGGSLVEFEKYYKSAGLPWITRAPGGRVGSVELAHIRSNPDHLILLKEKTRIIGHMIWHESNPAEHMTAGRPRSTTDRKILRRLLGRDKEFVELHELWLIPQRRGKGYGTMVFDFFEKFASRRGFCHIVHYAFDPAALALCRKRGYREEFGVMSGGRKSHVFCLDL